MDKPNKKLKKLNPYRLKKWHRLDNSAIIYPAISGDNLTNTYRVSATLKDDINPEILQLALENTLKYFIPFKVRLKAGFFWNYLEDNALPPIIKEENDFPCRHIDFKRNNLYLFQVSYYKKRINIEIFHALTDGTGGFKFLKAICYQYILLAYPEKFFEKEKSRVYGISHANISEDSYKKYYEPKKMKKVKSKNAFTFKGARFPFDANGEIHGYIPIDQMKKVCKEKDCTITQYLVTCLFWGIYTETLNQIYPKKSVNIFTPVNLRTFFGSNTILNFFSGISTKIDFKRNDLTFEDILNEVKKQFAEKLTREYIMEKLAFKVGGGYSFPIRLVPLPIKNFVLKLIYLKGSKSNTMTLSNIGKIDVLEMFQDYFDEFGFLMSPSKKECMKSSVVSYEDTIVFTFCSVLENTDLQKAVFRKLASDGLDVTIKSNGVYNSENM